MLVFFYHEFLESFQFWHLKQMPHFPHPSLSPITLNLSISSLPHPHSYLPFQPPASPPTMSQYLSQIIHICSCFPAHTMLGQASVILIILFTCLGTYFSLSISSLHPTRSEANLSRKTSVNVQVELDAPTLPCLPATYHLYHTV